MNTIPTWPRVLGLVALVPQIACLIAVHLGPEPWREAAIVTAFFYAAAVLVLLGGGWWGIAAGAPAAERRHGLGWLWLASILTLALAMACLLARESGWLPIEPVLVMLASGLLLCFVVDQRIAGLTARWWAVPRIPLTLGVGAVTFLLAIG